MKTFRRFIEYLHNPEVDFQTRIFALLTPIGMTGEAIVLIGDIIFGENLAEIVLLAVSLMLIPVISITTIKLGRSEVGAMIIVNYL